MKVIKNIYKLEDILFSLTTSSTTSQNKDLNSEVYEIWSTRPQLHY